MINFYNPYHLGDNIYTLTFLNNIIENNNDISFGVNPKYLPEIRKNNYKNIKLNGNKIGINSWIQANNFWGKFISGKEKIYYDEFYFEFYKDLAKRNNLKYSFKEIEDTLYYHSDLETRRYDDYDFFIMNSLGYSGQYNYNYNAFVNFVNKLKDFKVITTEKILGVDSTMEKGMNLLDIANLTIGCKYVIGVHTAPYATALNKKSIDSVKKWVVLNDKNITYKIKDDFLSYENILDVKIDDIINELV